MSQLLDEILSSENMKLAYKKVKANKGASGTAERTIYAGGEIKYIKPASFQNSI